MAASALLGAFITIVLRQDPGAPLGVILVLGTIVAGFAVRPLSARLIIPAPVLCYVPAATVSGAINDRAADTSKISLIAHGGNWISSGFVAMCIATIAAVTVTGLRMLQDFRARPRTRRGAQRPVRYPEDARPRRPDSARPDSARPDSGRPDSARPDRGRPEASRPDATGPSRPSTPAGSGPRRPPLGSGPYGAPPSTAPPSTAPPSTAPPSTAPPPTAPRSIPPPPTVPPAIGPGRGSGTAPGPSRPRPGTNPYPPQRPSGRGGRYNFSSGA